MLYPVDFERRAVDTARRATDDIPECRDAEVSVVWHGQAPVLRFVFGPLAAAGRPSYGFQMVAESRKNPLAPGRLVEGDELVRRLRTGVEQYLKLNGIDITRKLLHAHV